MHPLTSLVVLILGTLFLGACASTPDQPTTTYDQQVSRQTDEEFTRTLNER